MKHLAYGTMSCKHDQRDELSTTAPDFLLLVGKHLAHLWTSQKLLVGHKDQMAPFVKSNNKTPVCGTHELCRKKNG